MSNSATTGKPSEARDKYGMTPADWARLDAMTDVEVDQAARADPDAQPLSDEQLARFKRVARATFVRRKLGLTREQFAERYRIPLETLHDWEHHRAEPDATALAFLLAIEREPEAVARALAPEAA